MSPRAWSFLKIAVLLLFLAGVVFLFRFTPVGDHVNLPSIRSAIESLDPFAARLAYVILYIAGAVLLLPGILFSLVGALVFGVLEGTLYTWVGACIGASLSFLMARRLGRDFVERILGGRVASLDDRLREHGFTSLLIMRLLPIFPFVGVNFGSGLTSIRFKDFLLATMIGILPGTFVYQFLFARFGEKILAEGFSWTDLLDPILGLALGLFIAFILIGHAMSKRLKRKDDQT